MGDDTNRVILGDCLEIMRDIPDKSIDMILTDLPYGTTACSWDTVISFEPLWNHYKRIVKNNACICLFGSQPFTTDLIMSNRKWFKYEWIWDKNNGVNFYEVNKRPLKTHENIFIFYKKQCKYKPQKTNKALKKFGKINIDKIECFNIVPNKNRNSGVGYPKSVINIRKLNNLDKEMQCHPTQKPVNLFSYLIKTYTDENDLVLDNCAGSGTTAVSCIKTGRRYILIEKEKKYVDICYKRIREAEESVSLLNTI